MSSISNAVKKYKYSMAIWSDHADFIMDKDNIDEAKLLEIRCFSESGEFHAVRSCLGDEFSYREIKSDSDSSYGNGFYDEIQYLDIDSEKTEKENDGFFYTTGGGKYHLPEDVKNNKMLIIRNYYIFNPENGIAQKFDWRIVGFTNNETVRKDEK